MKLIGHWPSCAMVVNKPCDCGGVWRMEPINPSDLIGNSQVRELCGGISRHTLLAWRREKGFPAPVATIERTEIWDRRAVNSWRSENRKMIAAGRKIARGKRAARRA